MNMNEENGNDTVRENNLSFLELYKSVDRFIRDAYGSDGGVSEYLREMEAKEALGQRYVEGWPDDHGMLKRARWIRNQLSHEIGYDSEILEASDLAWLNSFKERLYGASDPLAAVSKQERIAAQRRAEEQKRRQAQLREQAESEAVPAMRERRTLWQRIIAFFRGE